MCYDEYNHIMWVPYWGRSRRKLGCASPPRLGPSGAFR